MKWYHWAGIGFGVLFAGGAFNRQRVMNDLKKVILSKNFNLAEMVKTATGLENIPGEKEIEALRALCLNVLQPLRDYVWLHYKMIVIINSAFRSETVNSATPGSSSTSQHPKGQAADVQVKDPTTGRRLTNQEIIDIVRMLKLPYDQLIDEEKKTLTGTSKWVHISHNNQKAQRVQWLTRRDPGPDRPKEYETVKYGYA